MASWAFPFNFCFIKWLFSRDLHYLRSGITAARRITPGTNSHLRVPRLRSPPSPEFPFPHSSPPYHKASREWGRAVGRTTNAQQPARPRHRSLPAPPPSNLPPRSKAAQPGASTRNPHPELNDRHDARGAGGRREEAGRGERHTRPRRALSAIRAPPPAGANTRGGRTAPGPRVAPPPPAAPPPPVSPHAMPL